MYFENLLMYAKCRIQNLCILILIYIQRIRYVTLMKYFYDNIFDGVYVLHKIFKILFKTCMNIWKYTIAFSVPYKRQEKLTFNFSDAGLNFSK